MRTKIGAVITALTVVGLILLAMWAFPQYRVYSQTLRGQAALQEAEYNRQIAIREAEARLASEKLNAQSEVERAKGAAESIEIEAGQITENYIRYLWVRQLDSISEGTIIYIPTEAGLPILEAQRGAE